jgi:hypothetical protein
MLPIEFLPLADKVKYVQQVNENEYHSSCPNCGGEPHADGSLPDRFVMWIVSKRGTPFGMCIRKCGWRWSPNKQDTEWTQEERAEFQRKAAQMEADYNAKVAEKLETLSQLITAQQVWKRYHDEMPVKAAKYYSDVRGIPQEWQDFLFLGYMPNYTVRNHLITYKDAAYTIPLYNFEGAIENITLRVENPIDKNDRYRRLYKSHAQHLYAPRMGKSNKVVLMEGELKAITGEVFGGLPSDFVVYGVQSKTPEKRILKMLDFAEVVYIAFDPDAYVPEGNTNRIAVIETAKIIGFEKTRLVIPPCGVKFDDAMLQGYNFSNAVQMAIRPERI